MGELEVRDRVLEVQEAWRLWVEGKSKSEIARRLERNRRTVDTYLEEAGEWVRDESLQTKQAAIVSGHRRIIERAWEMLDSGQIQPTSLAGPQYLMQIREALKEVARIEGLYVDKREIKHTGGTIADIARAHAEQAEALGYGDDLNAFYNKQIYDNEQIEDAEIVDDTEEDETP